MLRERGWRAPGMLEKLGRTVPLRRLHRASAGEAELTLDRFAPRADVRSHRRHVRRARTTSPRPKACSKSPTPIPDAKLYYVGDTVDDARCRQRRRVPFIGIAAPSNPLYIDLVFLFQAEGAYAIVDDINYLEEVFAS